MDIDLSLDKDVKLEQARLGGGSFLWESGVYDCVVDMAYLDKTSGGANSLVLTLMDNAGKKLKHTFFVTTKAGATKYQDSSGKSRYMAGFQMASNLALVTTEEDLGVANKAAEKKTINVYDFTARAEKPTEKKVLVTLLGKKVKVAVIQQKVNKRAPNSEGVWVATAEEKEENVIKEFFFADTGATVVEKMDKTDPAFLEAWKDKYEGVTLNLVKSVPGGSVATNSTPAPTTIFGE